MTTTYKAVKGQSLFDVALQHYGSLDGGLAQLMEDNPESLLSTGLFAMGPTDWKIRTGATVNKAIVDKMSEEVPVSGEGPATDDPAYLLDDTGGHLVDGTGAGLTED